MLRDLKDVGALPGGSASILSEPEPKVEEAQEYETIMNWLSKLNVQAYLMRASGHYYPYELKKVIDVIKPKKVNIIHTKAPPINLS